MVSGVFKRRSSIPELAGIEPLLIPTPARVRFDGRWVREAGEPHKPRPGRLDPSLAPGGYRISFKADGSWELAWGSEAAKCAMYATIDQLVSPKGRPYVHGPRPVIEIEDEPAFGTRGFMLDVSRDKVPNNFCRVGPLLHGLKFNHAQFYTEHTFAYAGHEAVWRGASPLTREDLEHKSWKLCFDMLAVEVAPNQNCFGHLSRWLRLPEYAHLAETHGAWKFLDFERTGPFSLCPIDERSEALVADVLGQLCPLFKSRLVNIGCDETFDVGFGRSAAEVDRRAAVEGSVEAGRASLYFEFVNKIAAIARGLGKRPMLWADIALSHPQMLDRWPRDPSTGEAAIGLAWGYEPDAQFASWCELLGKHGIEAWVCPGTSTWRSFAGRTTERRANLRAACEALKAGTRPTGFLLTDWGDCGHLQHWIFTQLALAEGAEAAWRGELPSDDDHAAWGRLHAAIDLHVFNSPGSGLAGWLSELGDIDLELRRAAGLRNQSALFVDLFPHTTPRRVELPRSAFADVRVRLAEHAGRLKRVGLRGDVLDQIDHTLAMMSLAVEHAIATRPPAPAGDAPGRVAPSTADRERLRRMTAAIENEHRRIWMKRNRPGGLEDSCSQFRKVAQSLNAGAS